jgi:hypothetical protein
VKIIAENDMKRGDWIVHKKRYEVTYLYLDKVAKEAKRGILIAYAVYDGLEKQVKKWYHDTQPYEVMKVRQLEDN